MQASPSKARAEALESHSWSLVLTWLSTLCHPSPIPSFERDATTLKALQKLMTENIAAEKWRDLLFLAQIEGLAFHQQERLHHGTSSENEAESLLHLLALSLPASSKPSLDSLSASAVLLGCFHSATLQTSILESLQSQILSLPGQTFALATHLSCIDSLNSNIREEISQFQRTLSGASSSIGQRRDRLVTDSDATSLSPPRTPITSTFPTDDNDDDGEVGIRESYSRLHAQTLRYQLETKQLMLKCAEYTDRIAALERQISSRNAGSDRPTLADVASKQTLIDQKKRQVETLEMKILEFHGLPPDIDASRAEVQRAQVELDELKRRREELFERLSS
ncbi:hypothetical protein PV05_09364 [Exophiala xenobiotica]|uniref:Uncharacterized protein n=1 Tax=Exophiala xenobiotica TaxID=348802 RepID=A0A0D2E774_9EURO|nr:uncharacterized protein PV05_09364 [Exophiala xenobiotica]KIW50565.1 hypothetical protein PV05_09364 [Exophiala xenobiotica]